MTASEGDSLELRLVADNVFEIEQFIHLSGEDGPSGDEGMLTYVHIYTCIRMS